MTPAFWIDLRFDERVKSKTVPTQQNDRVSSSQRGESRNEEELRQPAALKGRLVQDKKAIPIFSSIRSWNWWNWKELETGKIYPKSTAGKPDCITAGKDHRMFAKQFDRWDDTTNQSLCCKEKWPETNVHSSGWKPEIQDSITFTEPKNRRYANVQLIKRFFLWHQPLPHFASMRVSGNTDIVIWPGLVAGKWFSGS